MTHPINPQVIVIISKQTKNDETGNWEIHVPPEEGDWQYLFGGTEGEGEGGSPYVAWGKIEKAKKLSPIRPASRIFPGWESYNPEVEKHPIFQYLKRAPNLDESEKASFTWLFRLMWARPMQVNEAHAFLNYHRALIDGFDIGRLEEIFVTLAQKDLMCHGTDWFWGIAGAPSGDLLGHGDN